MDRSKIRGTLYKKTTDIQHATLIREICRYLSRYPACKTKGEYQNFWCQLGDNLNNLGPPSRTITEWKKVWKDCQRSSKRREEIKLVMQQARMEHFDETQNSFDSQVENESSQHTRRRREDVQLLLQQPKVENVDETQSSFDFPVQNESSQHSFDSEMNINESTSSFNLYTSTEPEHQETANENMEAIIPHHLPPLYRRPALSFTQQPPEPLDERISTPHVSEADAANSSLNPDILNALKMQMDQQTKLLAEMSNTSKTMASLMERQVTAIENQTVAIRRQAIATEHHTLVMNSFVDMVRDKMPKLNNRATNQQNGDL